MEQKIVYENMNPRKKAQTESFFTVSGPDSYGALQISDKASLINQYKNYLKFQKTEDTIDVCTLDQF